MTLEIKIDCETIGELFSHLAHLDMQIRKQVKKHKLSDDADSFPTGSDLELCDSNCYGTHEVIITY
jgi:hypothetical protein